LSKAAKRKAALIPNNVLEIVFIGDRKPLLKHRHPFPLLKSERVQRQDAKLKLLV